MVENKLLYEAHSILFLLYINTNFRSLAKENKNEKIELYKILKRRNKEHTFIQKKKKGIVQIFSSSLL